MQMQSTVNAHDKWATDLIGQHIYCKEAGGCFKDEAEFDAEIGQLVTGKKKGSENPEQKRFSNPG
jgi:hypothetical protein